MSIFQTLIKLDDLIEDLDQHRLQHLKDAMRLSNSNHQEAVNQLRQANLMNRHMEVLELIRATLTLSERGEIPSTLEEAISLLSQDAQPTTTDPTTATPVVENPEPEVAPEAPPQVFVTPKEYWTAIRENILVQLSQVDTKTSHQIIDDAVKQVMPDEVFTQKDMRDAVSSRIRRLKEEGLVEKVGDSRKILQLSQAGRDLLGLEPLTEGSPDEVTVDGPKTKEKFHPESDPTIFNTKNTISWLFPQNQTQE